MEPGNKREIERPGSARKWTVWEEANHIERILNLVEEARGEFGEERFTGVGKEELTRKFQRVNSPMIIWQGWSSSTSPGGSIGYNVGIYNPDPVTAFPVFAAVFVGTGNVVASVGEFLLNVDVRFPQLAEPGFPGLNLAPATATSLSFQLAVPSGIQPSNYFGNTCLMDLNWHDVGTYLDRSVFPFEVI